jgi:hypothetical protein
VQVLSDFVKFGHSFVISGYSNANASDIKISLSTGTIEGANAALLINPRYNENRIVRSAFVNGSFSNAESDENMSLSCDNVMPLKAGEQFTFCIFVGDDRFHIAINDVAFCTYRFQMPTESIRSIIISGEIDALVKVNHMKMFPYIYPNIRSDYEELAFEGFIPREYEPGHLVTITGNVNGKSDGEFIIMFNKDETKRQLIHFNVRFDEQSVVMNSMADDEEG